ncbi:Ger(x)C family spore germination protein [Ammoniphilus sp. 3BR4]|uniref:Ger(x)C family spore germination protein n=1 Tax=Ammoniphilus sp. 3BR4 TaxID=3158265 RepID=UPI003465EDA1
MNKITQLFALLFILLAGCSADIEKPTLEDLGMVGVIGFDYVNEKETKITVALPQPYEQAKEKSQVYSTVVQLTQQAPVVLSAVSERSISLAQLRVILISEEYARKTGIHRIMESLYRDPIVGTNVFIAITKGSAESLMKADYPNKPNITVFLNDLLHPRGETAFSPFTTIHNYIYFRTDEISEPMAPYIEKLDSSIRISKIALFKRDKLIGFVAPEEAKIIQGLRQRTKLPDFMVKIKEEEKDSAIVLNFVNSKVKLKSNGNLQNPELWIHLDLKGSVLEYTGKKDLETQQGIDALEKAVSEKIRNDCYKLLDRFKKLKIDPLSLGDAFRRKHRGTWSKEKWIEAFAKAEIHVQISTEIVGTGTLK